MPRGRHVEALAAGPEHALGHDELARAQVGREAAADAARDHERIVEPGEQPRPARAEEAGPQADRRDPEQTATEGGKGQDGDRRKLEPAGQDPRLELNRGEDQNSGQLPAAAPFSAFSRSLRSSHARQLFPAAVSLPVNLMLATSA